jgi:glycine/D-amino acid oxidase-like deaminating enzyme
VSTFKIGRLPQDDASNGWSRILPPRTPRPPLEGERQADWLVLGAGFAGLAAAQRLAHNRPNETVMVLEAGAVGEGASGRNSGFAIDLPHNVGSSLEELQGSRRFMRLARAAIGHLETEVRAHGIDCGWARRGKYHAAVSAAGVADVLEPVTRELEALEEAYEWVEGDALRAALGTGHFRAAVYTPGCVLMNPAALTRGLADSLPETVTLHEGSPVTAMEHRNGITLITPRGRVTAPRLILAVNSFADQFGCYAGELMSFAAHASLSRPLTPAEREAYGVERDWGMTPANAFAGITMRYTPDHRILIRQDIHYCPAARTSAAKRRRVAATHKRLFDARFPMLPEVEMEHTWTGYPCLSRNGAPGFGQVAPTIHTAVCQNAVGVTKGTIGGILAADLACGLDNPLIADMQSLGRPVKLPPRPFVDLGAIARMRWEVWRARAEA